MITQNTWFLLALSLLIQLGESHRIKSFIRGLSAHTSFSTISREHVEYTLDPRQDRDSEVQFVDKFEAQKWPF
ncbi:hypothetical protein GQ44DRAFT_717609 [Phaeosphaeriaceae sp. PMI808]|nr:hypothetical protein GQ44DRAFT_717609 [Phaeosphaeriaceae sp. PMI808]